ncbi:hypothetical protein AB1L42_01330 [Thalassoglobus sp. JC818]|uniref:hypothetical protein n=1 Tax=Thalassoglobus sp. JC818 TaxID=3232136 RepID=UPI00345B13B2
MSNSPIRSNSLDCDGLRGYDGDVIDADLGWDNEQSRLGAHSVQHSELRLSQISALSRARNLSGVDSVAELNELNVQQLKQRQMICLNQLSNNLAHHLGSHSNGNADNTATEDDGLYKAMEATLSNLIELQVNALTHQERETARADFDRLVNDLEQFDNQTLKHTEQLLAHCYPNWTLGQRRQFAQKQNWWRVLPMLGFDPATNQAYLHSSRDVIRKAALQSLTDSSKYGFAHDEAVGFLNSISSQHSDDETLEFFREIVLMGDQTELYRPGRLLKTARNLQNKLSKKHVPEVSQKDLKDVLDMRVETRRALQRSRVTLENTMSSIFNKYSKKNLKAIQEAARKETLQVKQIEARRESREASSGIANGHVQTQLIFDENEDDAQIGPVINVKHPHQSVNARSSVQLEISDENEELPQSLANNSNERIHDDNVSAQDNR